MYDVVVIGSSPVAIFQAIKSARHGLKTVIIEKDQNVGGAWKTRQVYGIGQTESACHLIEFYAGVYETLSDLIGIDFIKLEPQPIRILPNGKHIAYTTKKGIVCEFLYLCSVCLALILFRMVNIFLPKCLKIKKGQKLSIRQYVEKILLVGRYRLLKIFDFEGIKGPRGGYESFAARLQLSLNDNEIEIIHSEVISVSECDQELKPKQWQISLNSGNYLLSEQVYCTESTYLKSINKDALYSSKICYNPKEYWHILVSIVSQNVMLLNPYIHLPKNEYFHRITTCYPSNSDDSRRFFLIQMRHNPNQFNDLMCKIKNILIFSQIASADSEIVIHKIFTEKFIGESSDAQFVHGEYNGSLSLLKSIGDLGKAMVLNSQLLES